MVAAERPHSISKAQLQHLEDEGYAVVENVLDPSRDLDPILDEFSVILDRLARSLLDEGRIRESHDHLGFEDRLIAIIAETGESHSQNFDFSLPKGNIGGGAPGCAPPPMYTGNALFQLMTNERILDCIEDILGPEIYSNPVQHTRLKPPNSIVPKSVLGNNSVLVNTTPWHQDLAVLTPDADATEMVTVWIPLGADATVSNGCLLVIPGSHKGTLLRHCPNGNGVLKIPDALLEDSSSGGSSRGAAIPVEVKRGSILIFHRKLAHASLPNNTETLRSSLDLRYQPIGQRTGRDVFPGFVARSRRSPSDELRDRNAWDQKWREVALAMTQPGHVDAPFDRWSTEHDACA